MRKGKILRYDTSFGPAQDSEYVIEGVAIVFNEPTTIYELGGFSYTEKIAPEAVDNAIARGDDVRCLVNHDPNIILGRSIANTVEYWKEPGGLRFRCQLDPEISLHRDYWRMVQRGDINQCSFRFSIDDEIEEIIDGEAYYTITDMHLYDVSVVVYPAYANTAADARSAEPDKGERDDPSENAEHDITDVLDLFQTEVDFL